MVPSLSDLCFKKISMMNERNLDEKIPRSCYNDYISYLMNDSYTSWHQKIKYVNLEVNIKDMTVDQDMYFDELTYHIFVKKKINDDDDEDFDGEDEYYVFYHEYRDCPIIYDMYSYIAKKRKLIDENDDYYDYDSNDYDHYENDYDY
jgi:hypothetical protein